MAKIDQGGSAHWRKSAEQWRFAEESDEGKIVVAKRENIMGLGYRVELLENY